MLGTFIKTVRNLYYHYPKINQDHEGDGPFATLKIANDSVNKAQKAYEDFNDIYFVKYKSV